MGICFLCSTLDRFFTNFFIKHLHQHMISLTKELIEQIEAHAERDYPHECGGMLIGHFDAEKGKSVIELFPMENASAEETRHNRVLILPKDVMRAERYAREKKLDVVGYYHSHPDDKAVPSQFDLDHALPVWSYIIVSVLKGEAVDVRSWQMEDDRSKFNEEKKVVSQ
ncbi:MAG: putative metal-dependent protease of the superfamily [Acidobacteria bacterium]|nr:putative metal-dependent protease of the superfamily [Acidobacteriota bacterium]